MPRTFYSVDSATSACGLGANSVKTANETGPSASVSILTSSSASQGFSGSVTLFPATAAPWAAGDITITVEVVTANMNVTLRRIDVLRYNSDCSVNQQRGSLGLTRSLASTGSADHVVSLSEDATVPTDTSKMTLQFYMDNGAMSNQSVTLKITAVTSVFDTAFTVLAGTVRV